MTHIFRFTLLSIAVAFFGAVVATAAYAGDTGLGKLAALVLGAIGWIVTNYLGKPMLEIEDQRRQAIAREAIGSAGTALRAYARTSTWPVRLYCKWCGYDLEWAARMIFSLWLMGGDERYSDIERTSKYSSTHIPI